MDLTHSLDRHRPGPRAARSAEAAEGQDQFNFHLWLQQEAGRAAWSLPFSVFSPMPGFSSRHFETLQTESRVGCFIFEGAWYVLTRCQSQIDRNRGQPAWLRPSCQVRRCQRPGADVPKVFSRSDRCGDFLRLCEENHLDKSQGRPNDLHISYVQICTAVQLYMY